MNVPERKFRFRRPKLIRSSGRSAIFPPLNPKATPAPETKQIRQTGDRARRLFAFTILQRTVWVTGFGFSVIVMAVILGAAAFNTGTNLLYVMLSLLFALFTLSAIMGWVNLNGLRVKRIAPAESYVGRAAEIQVVIKNSKRWMSSWGLAVEEGVRDIMPAGVSAYFLAAPAGGSVVAQSGVTFRRRGLYRLEGVRLGTIFPFALLEFRSRQADPLDFIVYPEIVPVGNVPRRLVRGAGDEENPEKGRASGLHSIRDYAPGDPARDIHWRLSAKGTGLKLREYESESAHGVQLVLDISRGELKSALDHERMEKAISLTASLAKHYLGEDIEVMVWTAAGVVPRGSGPAQLKRILRSLALLSVEEMREEATVPPPPPDMTQFRIRGGTIGEVAGPQRESRPGGGATAAVAAAGRGR